MSLHESHVEDAALEWFGELGYAVGHGPHFAPGEPATERASFGDVVLVGRLRDAISRLNPAIPEEAREEALRKILRQETAALTPALTPSMPSSTKPSPPTLQRYRHQTHLPKPETLSCHFMK